MKNIRLCIFMAIIAIAMIGCTDDDSNDNGNNGKKEPNIAFVARNPIIESLYSNGFFNGCRINFDLVVYDAAGMTSITISEEATGAPNGNRKTFTQTRVIPISGTGTYPLSQEILRSNIYGNIYSQFVYTVSAHDKSYTTNYPGDYSSYNGAWSHHFVIK